MKKYKSNTQNQGTTIILDDVTQAITLGNTLTSAPGYDDQIYSSATSKERWEVAVKDLYKPDKAFIEAVNEMVDEVVDLVDGLEPKFSMNVSGYNRSEEGITTTPDLLLSGEDLCMFKKKSSEEKPLKKGKGDGAFRLIINTDVSWWGNPQDNCTLVGAMITILRRFCPVELYIQQGWIGRNIEDGVTLFKLDFTGGMSLADIVFWIKSEYKDVPFSRVVNLALGRKDTATSCIAEIECDLMFRGDWQHLYKMSWSKLYNLTPFERTDLIANYIKDTAYKIVFDDKDPSIHI